MLELKSRSLKLSLDGKECEISFPKMWQVEEFNEKIEGADASKQFSLMKDFLESLGMSKDFYYQLEADHIQAIMEQLKPQKKS